MGKKSKRSNPKKGKNKKKSGGERQERPQRWTYEEPKKKVIFDNDEWTRYDELLIDSNTYYEEEDSAKGSDKNKDGSENSNDQKPSAKGEEDCPPEKGSFKAIKAAIDHIWSKPEITNPNGIGIALGPKEKWVDFARVLANSPRSATRFLDDYKKDVELHKSTLETLSNETLRGCSGSTDYVLALNCIFHDTFDRLSLDMPPPLSLTQGVHALYMNGDHNAYNTQLQVWRAYEMLTLEMIKVVVENPLVPGRSAEEEFKYLPEVEPIKSRGKFPACANRQENNEEYDSEDEYGGYGGFSENDVLELYSQGVKPWDDDAYDVMAALQGLGV